MFCQISWFLTEILWWRGAPLVIVLHPQHTLKVLLFIKEFLSKTMIFYKYLTNLTKLPGIWQIWWYLITNSELFAEEIHLFAIKYHPFCQIPGSFVKYVKYLLNISVFDRKYLMKKWSLTWAFLFYALYIYMLVYLKNPSWKMGVQD